MCQALADRKEADLEELENRDYEKKMPAWLKRVELNVTFKDVSTLGVTSFFFAKSVAYNRG